MNCDDFQERFIEDIEGNFGENESGFIQKHISECVDCSEEYRMLKQIIGDLDNQIDPPEMPLHFFSNVRRKTEKYATVQKKKRKWGFVASIGLAASLTVFTGTVIATNGFSSFTDWWQGFSAKENEQLEQLTAAGYAEPLKLEAISNDIKITITDVVADDIQTTLYYEVEDLKRENLYNLGLENNIFKQVGQYGERQLLQNAGYSYYSANDYVYKGKQTFESLISEDGFILASISELLRMRENSIGYYHPEDPEYSVINGEWDFEIPVKKHEAKRFDFNVVANVKGIKLEFYRLIVSPTTTKLHYRVSGDEAARSEFLIDSLEVNDEKVHNEQHFKDAAPNNHGYDRVETFDSIYFKDIQNVKINIATLSTFVENSKEFTISPDVKNQTFEYLGNEISIANITMGNPTTFTVHESFTGKRNYTTLYYDVRDELYEKGVFHGFENTFTEGKLVDIEGNAFDYNSNYFLTEEIEKPLYYSTSTEYARKSYKGNPFIPSKLVIEGYAKTDFIDQSVSITLP
ncbi:DUF4179 domain-containing protein [Cytobacillus gottheilii]|uniref:DUF4179 domain-containing protein n=1 Tax=Cytobacillus gottheilii TaxID=859144 RepID=UPI003CE887BD